MTFFILFRRGDGRNRLLFHFPFAFGFILFFWKLVTLQQKFLLGTTVVGSVLFFFFPNTLHCIGINGLVRGLNTILYPRNTRLWLRKHSYTLQILTFALFWYRTMREYMRTFLRLWIWSFKKLNSSIDSLHRDFPTWYYLFSYLSATFLLLSLL